MKKNNYRLVQKILNLLILIAQSELVKNITELLSMAFNYHSYLPRYASA
ncbi:hypothetical protein SAMN05421881_11184 [Nitrosomonas halophila]|uniref:Uncharacterized protein n=1 Tax=Nitrosomonas halophila TaxID=44576 RepID=A0A1H3PY19_9PROT|nr:hypothetical protein SAMN05421881_11184 [Nitrosomonas halophila]